jgi:hypothetical protein
MGGVWKRVNQERRELLVLKAYKDAFSYANIVDQPTVSEFELEDELGSNLDDSEGYRSVLVGGERATESDQQFFHIIIALLLQTNYNVTNLFWGARTWI